MTTYELMLLEDAFFRQTGDRSAAHELTLRKFSGFLAYRKFMFEFMESFA